jgi:hypothetical protein
MEVDGSIPFIRSTSAVAEDTKELARGQATAHAWLGAGAVICVNHV